MLSAVATIYIRWCVDTNKSKKVCVCVCVCYVCIRRTYTHRHTLSLSLSLHTHTHLPPLQFLILQRPLLCFSSRVYSSEQKSLLVHQYTSAYVYYITAIFQCSSMLSQIDVAARCNQHSLSWYISILVYYISSVYPNRDLYSCILCKIDGTARYNQQSLSLSPINSKNQKQLLFRRTLGSLLRNYHYHYPDIV